MDRNLIDYIPMVLRDILEFKEIMNTDQKELADLWDAVENALNDQFVNDATNYGVTRWEKILKIIPRATESLDARKFRILARLNEQLPFTLTTLKQQLESLCGPDGYVIELQKYTLIVKVALIAKSNFDDVNKLLKRVAPANLVIDLTLKYNQHRTIKKFINSHLKQYSQRELRNEVLT